MQAILPPARASASHNLMPIIPLKDQLRLVQVPALQETLLIKMHRQVSMGSHRYSADYLRVKLGVMPQGIYQYVRLAATRLVPVRLVLATVIADQPQMRPNQLPTLTDKIFKNGLHLQSVLLLHSINITNLLLHKSCHKLCEFAAFSRSPL